jgi:hypothetical protein
MNYDGFTFFLSHIAVPYFINQGKGKGEVFPVKAVEALRVARG